MRKGLNVETLQMMVENTVPGYCPVCGLPLAWSFQTGRAGQWAHFICNTKAHRKRFGSLIDSKYNGLRVCGLGCNNAVQLKYGNRPIDCDIMAEWIKEKEEAGA